MHRKPRKRTFRLLPPFLPYTVGTVLFSLPIFLAAKGASIMLKKTDNPIQPNHYRQHPSGAKCIDVIEHFCLNLGTAVKYLWRAGLKPNEPFERDLEKALWYIERENERVRHHGGDSVQRIRMPLRLEEQIGMSSMRICEAFMFRIGQAIDLLWSCTFSEDDQDRAITKAEYIRRLDQAADLLRREIQVSVTKGIFDDVAAGVGGKVDPVTQEIKVPARKSARKRLSPAARARRDLRRGQVPEDAGARSASHARVAKAAKKAKAPRLT